MSEISFDPLLSPGADPVQAGVTLKQFADDAELSGPALIAALAEESERLIDADPAITGGLLRLIHLKTLRDEGDALLQINPESIRRIMVALSPEVSNRHLMLQLLAMMRSDESLAILVQQLMESPPKGWMASAQILSPLMQHRDWPIDVVFPAILDCMGEPSLAAPVLDLAGHVTRTHQVDSHPARERVAALNALLGQVAGRLARFEEDPRSFGTEVDQVQAVLGEAVALAVSLCDAIGLIGDESSIGELNKTLDLKHRRVQCEAAGALAKLGQENGRERLAELAGEPAARLRAIAYADELGLQDLIDDVHREPSATAEAEMALWLTQPQQMGVPPTGVEVVDSRRMLWPSFNDPVDVFLVRFEYNFGEKQYSNIGITGPTVFTMSCDVADLPPEDIYAMYAGWHADHQDIFTVPSKEFNEAQRRIIEPLQTYLERVGYEDVKVDCLGFFLDETAAVFTAVRNEKTCVVVTDGLETIDLPTAGRLRPPSPEDLFNLYKGRKMLRTFNPSGLSE
ncbi:HEAT repeat domain-containing protein [Rhodopirellula halodulae]|uniref:HEAT repeat domain-containing protein n=1 Tax=Rhodopirellula halodulae TaxID=2894198 RepID=UPI001E50B1B6|nr:HEAT repeat domain-containing protein [Rhodopirellula sp. JC737]MCC9657414.1 HEAT repeat domain-containing protein [Rhodopirellula sp. JC737]